MLTESSTTPAWSRHTSTPMDVSTDGGGVIDMAAMLYVGDSSPPTISDVPAKV